MTVPADTAPLRKARGAFFTPPTLCRFISEWAIRGHSDQVLEPSCGEAAFLVAAGERLRAVGANGQLGRQLHGVELHEASAKLAQSAVIDAGLSAEIRIGDFFSISDLGPFDAVIGNPPYVRYQDFTGAARLRSQEAALRLGVPLTGLASSWASFVVHAAHHLTPTGRMGLVLPAELLSVNYAADIRRFLLQRFEKIQLVMFEQRVFPDVLEEVVLLLAEGAGPASQFQLCQVRNLAELETQTGLTSTWTPVDVGDKWTPALLSAEAFKAYTEFASSGAFGNLQTWGETTLGMVTGNNRYFAITAERVRELKLEATELLRISPPGSRHLRGLTLTLRAWNGLAEEGSRCFLFYPDADQPSAGASRYIDQGEGLGVNRAYKCRVRKPWYRVPLVSPPDLFLTYMNHDTPRLVANPGRLHYLNSVHGLFLRPEYRELGTDLLPIATLNSLTVLGAEMVGRSYGGGMLKLEPKEADRLPVPSPALVEAAGPELRALRPSLSTKLRQGDLLAAIKQVDRILLASHAGMERGQIRALREARDSLFGRRVARAST